MSDLERQEISTSVDNVEVEDARAMGSTIQEIERWRATELVEWIQRVLDPSLDPTLKHRRFGKTTNLSMLRVFFSNSLPARTFQRLENLVGQKGRGTIHLSFLPTASHTFKGRLPRYLCISFSDSVVDISLGNIW